MISKFPQFEEIQLGKKEEIEKIINKFPPYSDFNFASLYGYDILSKNKISLLNKNLIVKFHDYITLKPFFSVIGKNKISKTFEELINYSKNECKEGKLKLIPEEIVKNKNLKKKFNINEDKDSFDYILSINDICNKKNKIHYNKKKQYNNFFNNYPKANVKILNLEDIQIKNKIYDLCNLWIKNSKKDIKESENELIALKRELNHHKLLSLEGVGIFDNTKLIGFSIADTSYKKYGAFHFAKGDTSYKGVYSVLYISLSNYLQKKGFKYLNIQQDMGIEGLRDAKKQWHPTFYLKKYIISLKKSND